MDNALDLINKEINCIDTIVLDRSKLIIKDSTSNEAISNDSINNMLKDSADEDLPKAIIVEIEATHSGLTKNNTEYQSEYMKKSAKTWTTPYNKPVLLGHNSNGITLGRVKDYEFKKSELNPDKDTIKLTLEITDPGSVRRHLDGTALTYSIGASVKEAHCNICGNNILEDYCGHWKGNIYKIKKEGQDKEEKIMAKWMIGMMEYIEVSEVNVPADVWAQVLTVKAKEEDSKPDEKNKDDSEVDIVIDINTNIDELLNVNDSIEDTSTTNDISSDEDVANSISIDAIGDEIETLTASIAELKEELNLANIQIEESTKTIAENKLLTNENLKLKDENKKNQAINIEFAKTIKKLYTDTIISAKIRLGDISVENKTEELNSIMLLSSKELSEMYNEIITNDTMITNISVPKITQEDIGALKVNQDKVDIDDKKSSNNIKQKNTRFTAADAVDSLFDN